MAKIDYRPKYGRSVLGTEPVNPIGPDCGLRRELQEAIHADDLPPLERFQAALEARKKLDKFSHWAQRFTNPHAFAPDH